MNVRLNRFFYIVWEAFAENFSIIDELGGTYVLLQAIKSFDDSYIISGNLIFSLYRRTFYKKNMQLKQN